MEPLLLHFPAPSDLWSLVFSLFGVFWVMLETVAQCSCWQGRIQSKRGVKAWKIVPLCVLWTTCEKGTMGHLMKFNVLLTLLSSLC